MGVAYKLTNRVNGKGYIGITSQPLNWRINAHRSIGRKGRGYAISKAIEAHGFENFDIEILMESDDYEALKEAEQRLIREHDTFGADGRGYNLTRGGDGNLGWSPTAEQRAALSEQRRGRKMSAEARANISIARKGRIFTPETRAKIAAALKGRRHDPERIAAMIATKKARFQTRSAN